MVLVGGAWELLPPSRELGRGVPCEYQRYYEYFEVLRLLQEDLLLLLLLLLLK